MSPEDSLEKGINELELDLDRAAQQKLLDYVGLILKWNKVYNLTTAQTAAEIVKRHVLDSLAIVPHLGLDSMVDVGSGAGLPGIPVALARPQKDIVLLDSSHKRAAFLMEVCATLALSNVKVMCKRVEDFRPEHKFTEVCARAFSDLAQFVEATRHLLSAQGRWIAMKGHHPEKEIKALPKGVKVVDTIELKVPGLNEARSLIILKQEKKI
jgi:16S rRNA (guanine527-N7)-methyltransferase